MKAASLFFVLRWKFKMEEEVVTMSDVIISTKEGTVFHELFCPYVQRIQSRHRKQVTEEKAIKKGYCECKFCRSVRGIAYKYRQLCEENISYDATDNAICIKTDVGFWKLIWRENTQDWHLFHMNHRGWKCFDKTLPDEKLMRGSFHRQEDFAPTTNVSKALKYIRSHDKNYKIAEEDIRKLNKGNSKQKKHYQQQKNRKKRESIRNVYRIFHNLEKEKENA